MGSMGVHVLIGIGWHDYKVGFLAGELLLLCTLQACVSVEERQVTPGVFDVATPANHFINSEGRAKVILDLRARDLCSNGYSRLRESRIVVAKGLETMAWRIACAMP